MNILLTEECTRSCPYCFAAGRGRRGAPARARFIGREDFELALDFAVGGGERVLGLLGGEPSLHPDFPDLVLRALERLPEGRVKVFTNGMWPQAHRLALAKKLSATQRRRLAIIVNVNPPGLSSPEERALQVDLFEALGKCTSLSANVFEEDQDLGYLVHLITSHGLRPHIRLALAQPLVGGEGAFVPVEDYDGLAPTLLELAALCDEHDVTLGFDCGLVLCMFTAEQLGRLLLSGCLPRATCAPTIDVGPDLSVWSCFPLRALTRPARLTDFRRPAELVARFQDELFELASAGALPSCAACKHFRRRQCAGGCVAHAALRSRRPLEGI